MRSAKTTSTEEADERAHVWPRMSIIP